MTRLMFVIVMAAISVRPAANQSVRAEVLPSRLADGEFWQLASDLSEPEGFYSSENLVSSERDFPPVIRELEARRTSGGTYLGVGPEQNFHYIAAMRPQMAFILDIRRGNLLLHLLYKAAFELSERRSEFLSLLFSRRPLAASPRSASSAQLVALVDAARAENEAVHARNFQRLLSVLITRHTLTLTADDRERLRSIYRRFYWHGTQLRYASGSGEFAAGAPTLGALLASAESSGGSFLASEARYAAVRTLHLNNLIVPVVGDFAGPKALRAIGAYVRSRGGVVRAFYVSDVEQNLDRGGRQSAFCENAASLPRDADSVFIRHWPAVRVDDLGTCR